MAPRLARLALSAALCSVAAASASAAGAPPAACAVAFNGTLGSNMVLQQQPAQSAVFGTVAGDGLSGVSVKVTDESGASYSVDAAVSQGLWKALLRPAPAGGNYSVVATATCSSGQAEEAADNVTFGDVWYCE